jgi:hypothetical protein
LLFGYVALLVKIHESKGIFCIELLAFSYQPLS